MLSQVLLKKEGSESAAADALGRVMLAAHGHLAKVANGEELFPRFHLADPVFAGESHGLGDAIEDVIGKVRLMEREREREKGGVGGGHDRARQGRRTCGVCVCVCVAVLGGGNARRSAPGCDRAPTIAQPQPPPPLSLALSTPSIPPCLSHSLPPFLHLLHAFH